MQREEARRRCSIEAQQHPQLQQYAPALASSPRGYETQRTRSSAVRRRSWLSLPTLSPAPPPFPFPRKRRGRGAQGLGPDERLGGCHASCRPPGWMRRTRACVARCCVLPTRCPSNLASPPPPPSPLTRLSRFPPAREALQAEWPATRTVRCCSCRCGCCCSKARTLIRGLLPAQRRWRDCPWSSLLNLP